MFLQWWLKFPNHWLSGYWCEGYIARGMMKGVVFDLNLEVYINLFLKKSGNHSYLTRLFFVKFHIYNSDQGFWSKWWSFWLSVFDEQAEKRIVCTAVDLDRLKSQVKENFHVLLSSLEGNISNWSAHCKKLDDVC